MYRMFLAINGVKNKGINDGKNGIRNDYEAELRPDFAWIVGLHHALAPLKSLPPTFSAAVQANVRFKRPHSLF